MVMPKSINNEREVRNIKNGQEQLDALGLSISKSLKENIEMRSSSNHSKTEPSKNTFKHFFKRGSEIRLNIGLGFLKRRHTEGALLNKKSVRPSPEEAKKWGESFQNLMNSKYGQCLFRAFLRSEFSHENIDFWMEVEDYKKEHENKLAARGEKIINEYIITEAPRELNIDPKIKENLQKVSESDFDCKTFDVAQKKIQVSLETDAFTRFLKSELYIELIYPEQFSREPENPDKYFNFKNNLSRISILKTIQDKKLTYLNNHN